MRTSERTFSRISPSRILWAPWKFWMNSKNLNGRIFKGLMQKSYGTRFLAQICVMFNPLLLLQYESKVEISQKWIFHKKWIFCKLGWGQEPSESFWPKPVKNNSFQNIHFLRNIHFWQNRYPETTNHDFFNLNHHFCPKMVRPSLVRPWNRPRLTSTTDFLMVYWTRDRRTVWVNFWSKMTDFWFKNDRIFQHS